MASCRLVPSPRESREPGVWGPRPAPTQTADWVVRGLGPSLGGNTPDRCYGSPAEHQSVCRVMWETAISTRLCQRERERVAWWACVASTSVCLGCFSPQAQGKQTRTKGARPPPYQGARERERERERATHHNVASGINLARTTWAVSVSVSKTPWARAPGAATLSDDPRSNSQRAPHVGARFFSVLGVCLSWSTGREGM